MYLTASRRTLDANFHKDEENAKVRAIFPELYKTGNLNTIEVRAEIGYWRKANQIHGWFVENVQRGEDDCEEYYVDRADLAKLLSVCRAAKTANNADLLPSTPGFFFGGTAKDDWYWDDIDRTIEIIEKALNLPENWHVHYQASW